MESRAIAIAVNVYREPSRQIAACFERIGKHFASATVGIYCNGIYRGDVEDMGSQFGFHVIFGENLGMNGSWHLWWSRMLRFFLCTNAEVCFKFDPDTMVDAPPEHIPDADYFGSIWTSRRYGIPFIQGGITGLSRNAVELLLTSYLLVSPDRATVPMSPHQLEDFADDQHLAMALGILGIIPFEWKECKSLWKTPVINNPIEYSIVHPRYYPTRPSRNQTG